MCPHAGTVCKKHNSSIVMHRVVVMAIPEDELLNSLQDCFLQILLKELSSLTQESSKIVPPNISDTTGKKKMIYQVMNRYKSSLEPSQKHAKCASKCKQVLLILSYLFITSGIH